MTNTRLPIIESMPCIKRTSKTCSWSKFALLFIVCFILPTDGMSKTNDKGQKSLPKDVQTFLKNYDLCYYFLGEEPYNEKRRVYLSQQVEKYCPDIKSNLIHLKSKYKSNKELSKTLDAYDESVE